MQDVDNLFQQKTIHELSKLSLGITADSKNKQSELRLMVGDKYRDIISASDSISSMEQYSIVLQETLQETLKLTLNLPLHMKPSPTFSPKTKPIFFTASYIKLLTLTPQVLWQYLETRDYSKASIIYLISEAIYTNCSMMNLTTDPSFPIIRRQWDAISQFKIQIIQSASDDLVLDHNLPNTLSAIMILSDYSHSQALNLFLEKQSQFILNLEAQSAFDFFHVLNIHIRNTILACLIFFPTEHEDNQTNSESMNSSTKLNPSILSKSLDSLVGNLKNADSIKSVLLDWYPQNLNMGVIIPYLWNSVQTNSKINIQNNCNSVSDIQKIMDQWISNISSSIIIKSKKILQSVAQAKELSLIRQKTIVDISNLEHLLNSSIYPWNPVDLPWSTLTNKILGKDFSCWNDLLLEPFNTQFLNIVSNSLSFSFKHYISLIESHHKEAKHSGNFENNFISFVWKSQNANKFLTPLMRILTDEFDQMIHSLVLDFNFMLSCSNFKDLISTTFSGSSSLSALYSLESNSNMLELETQKLFAENLQTFSNDCISIVQLDCSQMTLENDDSILHQILFIGRLFRHLAIKIPNSCSLLQVEDTSPTRAAINHDPKNIMNEKSNKLSIMLVNVYQMCHEIWTQVTIKDFENKFKSAVVIEEWDHDEKWISTWGSMQVDGAMESETLALPVRTSAFLIQTLYKLCVKMQQAGSYDMEKTVLISFTAAFTKVLISLYQQIGNGNLSVGNISDKGWIQILFDYMFSSRIIENIWLMDGIVLNNKIELKRASQTVMALLKSKVDPIDLVVFESLLVSNVEKWVSKNFILLSPLSAFMNKGNESKKPMLSSNETHHVIALAPIVPRFPMLPIGTGKNSNHRGTSFSGLDPGISGYNSGAVRRKMSEAILHPKPIARINILPSNNIESKEAGADVFGLVGMSGGQQRATELFMNASSFLTGVLGGQISTGRSK